MVGCEGRIPGVEATFAVSFFGSGFTATGAGPAGAAGAGAGAGVAGFGADGAAGADGGFKPEGTPGADGGEGGFGTPGADGGFKPEGTPGADGGEGGFGAPGAVGGLGAEGAAGADGGLRPDGGGGALGAEGSEGAAAGFGGRLIIADSLGVEPAGCPSRRGGSTMRTVSFFGSLISIRQIPGFKDDPVSFFRIAHGCQRLLTGSLIRRPSMQPCGGHA